MFIKAIESVIKSQFEEYKATQIVNLKLNKDFKLSACKIMLNQLSTDIVCNLLDIKTKFSESAIYMQKEITDWMRDYAFNVTTFDIRKKNVERGENNPFKINEGCLIENRLFTYKGHYRGRSGSFDQAAFSLLFHRLKPIFIYRTNEMKKAVRIDLTGVSKDFQLLEARYKLTGKEKIMIGGDYSENRVMYTRSSALLKEFKGLEITWNEKERAFCYKNEKYHCLNLWSADKLQPNKLATTQTIVKTVISSFAAKNKIRRQRDRQVKVTNFVRDHLTSIFVTFEDSIKAGNCEKQTQEMYNRLEKIESEAIQKNNGKITGVRADFLLSIRNDHYTNNAIFQAAKRYL